MLVSILIFALLLGIYTPAVAALPFLSQLQSTTTAAAVATTATTTASIKSVKVVVDKGIIAPNGIAREAIRVNGQMPGPTFVFEQDDEVEFQVTNQLDEGTTIHFHGVEQRGTPWSDGVPGVSQRPIDPGESFLYKWTASQPGAYWYHSHFQGQIADGLHGAIIVNPRNGTDKPFYMITQNKTELEQLEHAERKSQAVLLGDWTNFTYHEVMSIEYASGVDNFCIDSIIINGKGKNICKPQDELNALERPNQLALTKHKELTIKGCLPPHIYEKLHGFTYNLSMLPEKAFDKCFPTETEPAVIEVDPADGWVSLTLIATSPATLPLFTIDNHNLWIYAVDGPYVEPRLVNGVSVPNSRRYQVFVKLDQQPGDYTIRVPSTTGSQIISGYAIFRYKGVGEDKRNAVESKPWVGFNGLNVTSPFIVNNDYLLRPYPLHRPAKVAQKTYIFDLGFYQHSWKWTLSGKAAFNDTFATPLLFDPKVDHELTFATDMDDWVDFIIRSPNKQPAHPIHKHSNKFYVIGHGDFAFTYANVEEAMKEHPEAFNLEDPPFADTFMTPQTRMGPSFLVLRYHIENPGAFMMHCHIQTHLDGGMG
ncbi:hypothetical protein KEM54_000097, partial [Ascosphaera aggregata]